MRITTWRPTLSNRSRTIDVPWDIEGAPGPSIAYPSSVEPGCGVLRRPGGAGATRWPGVAHRRFSAYWGVRQPREESDTGESPPGRETRSSADAAAAGADENPTLEAPADSRDPRPLPPGSWRRGDEPEFERLANFTDAVYAIALTLLVLQVGIDPVRESANVSEMAGVLEEQLPNLFAFALAFILIGRYWMAHHSFFATLRAWNQQIMGITLIYLAFVALLPFPTFLVGEYGDNPLSVVVFAATMATISALEVLMYARAHHLELMHRRLSPAIYRWGFRSSMLPVAMFVVTMPVAFVSPYLAMGLWPVIGFLGGFLMRRAAPTEAPAVSPLRIGVDHGARIRGLAAGGGDPAGPGEVTGAGGDGAPAAVERR